MAHILEFRCNAERAELDCEPMLQRSAQIIIFPGVRIERHAEPVAELVTSLRPSRAGGSGLVPNATG